MLTPTCLEALLDLVAEVTGHDRRTLSAGAVGSPFITLGGTLEQAVRLLACAEERLGLALDLASLLGPLPLADALSPAVPAGAGQPRAGAARLTVPAGQRAALAVRQDTGAAHGVLSAELAGPLDMAALRGAVGALSERHEGLRTVFVTSPEGPVRRVLDGYAVPLVVSGAPAPASEAGDPVAAVHARLAQDVVRLAGRAGRPPVVFVLTPLPAGRRLLSFLYHRAVADTRSAALVWRELLAEYGRAVAGGPSGTAPPADSVPARPSGPPRDMAGRRLVFGIDEEVRDAVDATARRAGVPYSTAVLAAWALAVGRRQGREELFVGVEVPRRPTAALLRTVAPGTATPAVRCVLEGTADYFLRGIACAFSEGLARADADPGPPGGERSPVRVTFAAHDELLPAAIRAGGLTARFHHGHLGGAVADASLTLLRWREGPLLALDHAAHALSRAEAAHLAADVCATLLSLALSGPWTPVDDLLPAPGVRGGAVTSAP